MHDLHPPPPPIHLLPLDKSKGSLDRVPASLEKRVGEPDQSSPTTANMCPVSNRHRRSAIFLPIVVIFYSWVLCCVEEWGQANSCNFNQNANVNTNTKNAFSSDMAQHCDQLISHFESVFLKQKISSILEYFITACPWIPDEDVANNEKFLMLVTSWLSLLTFHRHCLHCSAMSRDDQLCWLSSQRTPHPCLAVTPSYLQQHQRGCSTPAQCKTM